MELTRHCALCENEITSLKKGVTCKLTKKKPDFNKSCRDFKLNEKFEQELLTILLELERIIKFRKREYLIFCVLLVIGILAIMGSKVFAELHSNSPYYWLNRFIPIAVGITIIMGALFNLSSFRNKKKIALTKKNKIDSVLEKYRISYKTKFDYKEKIHGDQNIEITMEYKNWTKKRTTTMAIINTGFGL